MATNNNSGLVEVVRAITRLSEEQRKTNILLGQLVKGLTELTTTTREGYEGPMRLLTEMEEGIQAEMSPSMLDGDDIDEIGEEDSWRLG